MNERYIRDRYNRKHNYYPHMKMDDRHNRRSYEDDYYSKPRVAKNLNSYDYKYDSKHYMNDDDYYYDYNSGSYDDKAMAEYKEDSKKWLAHLKKKDKFNLPKNEILNKARNMGVQFNGYDEDDFYMTYLMTLNNFKSLSSDINTYLRMTKDWLEDDYIEGSAKIGMYMDTFYD